MAPPQIPKPHDYQMRAYHFGFQATSPYYMIDAGLGKTLISLMRIKKLARPVIVVAPLRVCYSVWPDEIKKWFPDMTYTILHGREKEYRLRQKVQIYLLNYDGLAWFFKQCCANKFPLKKYPFIFDESTFIKEPSTARFKLLRKMEPMFSRYVSDLSATPAPIGLHNLWSQYYVLDRGKRLGRAYSHYRDRYFSFSGPPYYRTTLRSPDCKTEIFKRIRDITFRLSANDYLDMPKLIHVVHKVKLTPGLQRRYRQFASEALLQLRNGETVAALSEIMLRSKLRQFLQGALYYDGGRRYEVQHRIKLDFLKSRLDELQGEPLLMPINYRFELDMIRKELGDVPYITGATNAKTSTLLVNAWNRGELPLLLCHPKSIGHGLNLQAKGRRILWMMLPFSIETWIQLIARLWRQGQTMPVFNEMLVVENTIDEDILPVLRGRNKTQNDLFNAVRRGLERR